MGSVLAVGSSATLARVAARLVIAGGAIRVSHPNRESVARVAEDIRAQLQLAVEQPVEASGRISFGDVVLEAIAQPVQTADVTAAENKLKDYARNFFENVWPHRPLKALAGNTPIDAVGSSLLRKRLFGVIRFVEDCLKAVQPRKQVGQELVPIEVFDFDALRHKLGLEYVAADPPKVAVPAEPPPAPAAHAPGRPPAESGGPKKRAIADMNTAELSALDAAAMSADELEQAMRAALKLDARELAVAFAQAGVGKPFDPAKPDRYPLYATAVTGASAAGDLAKAVELAEQGERYDAEHNAGGRAVEFGLKKAQLFVKMKDADRATAAFDAILAAHPDEGRFYTTAAEEMLRLKNGPKALHFAERGLARAKETGNRDLEGHCQELIAAAKRAG
jgi:tetratricopeptide (TPR) repeat protein